MSDARETNKAIVREFNLEVIQNIKRDVFDRLIDNGFVNHSGQPGNNGPESMWNTFSNILKKAFPDLEVQIINMIAEGDLVSTQKCIRGTHLGQLFDIAPSHKKIEIRVFDLVRIKDGKYFEHWGLNDFESIMQKLKS